MNHKSVLIECNDLHVLACFKCIKMSICSLMLKIWMWLAETTREMCCLHKVLSRVVSIGQDWLKLPPLKRLALEVKSHLLHRFALPDCTNSDQYVASDGIRCDAANPTRRVEGIGKGFMPISILYFRMSSPFRPTPSVPH